MADYRGEHNSRLVPVYVFLGLIANRTAKIIPFLMAKMPDNRHE